MTIDMTPSFASSLLQFLESSGMGSSVEDSPAQEERPSKRMRYVSSTTGSHPSSSSPVDTRAKPDSGLERQAPSELHGSRYAQPSSVSQMTKLTQTKLESGLEQHLPSEFSSVPAPSVSQMTTGSEGKGKPRVLIQKFSKTSSRKIFGPTRIATKLSKARSRATFCWILGMLFLRPYGFDFAPF